MHFQFFFPGKMNNAGACLRSVGLADFVDGAVELPGRVCDQDGLIVGWSSEMGYMPDRQNWVDSGEGYMVGFWTDSPATPKEIARVSLFPGYTFELGDGQPWQVPRATELPASLKLTGGSWKAVRKPQFNEYWDRSEIWFRRLIVFEFDEMRIREAEKITGQQLLDQWCDFCVFALRQNYRVTPLIASELGLLDTDSKLRIVLAAVDGMAIQEVLEEARQEMERIQGGVKKNSDDSIIPG